MYMLQIAGFRKGVKTQRASRRRIVHAAGRGGYSVVVRMRVVSLALMVGEVGMGMRM